MLRYNDILEEIFFPSKASMNFLAEETISCSAEFRFSTLFVMKAVKKERDEAGSKGKEWFRFAERVEFSSFSYQLLPPRSL